jgi:hypothetical protein
MDVLYVDAAAGVTGKVSWHQIIGMGYVWWFVAYMIGGTAALGLGSVLFELDARSAPPVLALLLPVTLVGFILLRAGQAHRYQRQRGRTKIDPYGVALSQIRLDLKAFGRDRDQAASWPQFRRKRSAALHLIAGAILFVSPALAVEWLGIAKTPLVRVIVLVVFLVAVFCLWRAVGLWRQRTIDLGRRLGSGALFVGGVVFPLVFTWLAAFVGIAAFAILAMVLEGVFGTRAVNEWGREYAWLLALAGVLLAVLVFFAAIEVARRMIGRAKGLALPQACELRGWDARRPIIMARSFADDSQTVAHTTTDPWDRSGTARLEQIVAAQLAAYGPVIAIGAPGSAPQAGAAKDYFEGEEWRRTILDWIDESLLVVGIVAGTTGLRWELASLLERNQAGKLLLLVPPGPDREMRWKLISRIFSGTPWYSAILSVDPRWAIAVHLRPKQLVVVCSNRQDRGDFEVAIDLALYGIFRAGH